MQPGSLRESQVFLPRINLWATEVIPSSYFTWLLSHKHHSFRGETEAEEQPWQFLWWNLIRLLSRLTIQSRREAWLVELMGHIPWKTKSKAKLCKGSGSSWGLLPLKACKMTGAPRWGTRDRGHPQGKWCYSQNETEEPFTPSTLLFSPHPVEAT